jgi:ribose transport system ATP-binding protein
LDQPLLQMKDIVKDFPGVHAVKKANLEVYPGEVLALIGENGAGKSTLMKVLSGAHNPDSGQIFLAGKELPSDMSPRQAIDLGISVIYQELNYLNQLSIAENLLLGQVPSKGRSAVVDRRELVARSREIQKEIGLEDKDPLSLLGDLTIGEKQLVEIGKAYARNTRILVMDEPTSALNDREIDRLFRLIRSAQAKGVGIIYISHKLDEIMEISDRVEIMRDGCVVGVEKTGETTKDRLISMMVGREIKDMYPIAPHEIGETVL